MIENEIKKPSLKEPTFFRESYDYRNIEYAGQDRGVGQAGKVGLNMSTSIDAMPPETHSMMVPRDFKERE